MAWAATAIVAGTVATGYLGAKAQSRATDRASDATERSTAMAVEEQRRQFDEVQKILAPFIETGGRSLTAQADMTGINGVTAQMERLNAIENSPEFTGLLRQGENAILQNASATGGLRGGNVQGALGQFRPALLSQLIQQQYDRLGGLTALGQASAAGQAGAAQNSGQVVSELFSNQGNNQANAALARGAAEANFYGGIGSTLGTLGTLKLLKKF